ncbi:hypothetical protein MNBD_NITROSPINAE01-1467 [hydrothermal vent metagenome]|uniref:Uncharacterized protein n=1 Tax=hydrothermal vent metagenome TaxID=652676 RepID=A0A3B1CE67_9ZZZZ
METRPKNVTIQDFLKELALPASELGAYLNANTHNSVDIKKITEFAEKVKNVHERLKEMFAGGGDARSKIIERFFINWNNTVLGVLYVSDRICESKSVSEKHYKILKASVNNIQGSLKDFGITQ